MLQWKLECHAEVKRSRQRYWCGGSMDRHVQSINDFFPLNGFSFFFFVYVNYFDSWYGAKLSTCISCQEANQYTSNVRL